eukprot:CAMPEP_0119023934 /NCGR_PEP_ID=MMETSP1176-20130426/30939_1 /TAXON_ID=265551 /ORGANISM="Synedropsis recta cf, Strain CCMP1620" /LENGTH=417 /DNA_ID=CAMNT_0006979103 /DNA_START=50 /DNA_END=1300 /DNA_ORIENTATION=+
MESNKSKDNALDSHHASEQQQVSKGLALSTRIARCLQLEDFDATVGEANRGGGEEDDEDTMSETESRDSDHRNLRSILDEEEEKVEEGLDRGLIEKATEAVVYKAVQEGVEDQDSSEQRTYSTELVHDLYRLILETQPDKDGARVDPSKWEPVRSYLLSSPDLTRHAARIRNSGGLTPFHQVCRHDPPMDIIELFISCVGLFVLKLIDDKGMLPVHHAVTNASPDIIIALARLYPESKVIEDISGATPLHFAITTADLDMAILLTLCTEGAASIADRHGMLPLHYAVFFKTFAKPQVVKLLIETYPLGLTTLDLKGRLPIRWLAKSCHIDDSLELLEYSFSLDPSVGKGDMGLLLLSNMEECAKKNGKSDNIQKFLNLLLKHNPDPVDAYAAALKRLPRWLNKTGEKPKRRTFFCRE